MFRSNKPARNRTTITTINFPLDLIERIDEVARNWAIENGYAPNRSRSRWIISLLREAIDKDKSPRVSISIENLAKEIHEATKELDSEWCEWDNCTVRQKGDFLHLAEFLIGKLDISSKEEESKGRGQ